MLAGKRAFSGETVLDTLHAITRTEPQPLREFQPDHPVELHRILRKCLAKNASRRYQGAGDLVIDLRMLAADVESGAAAATDHGTARRTAISSSRSTRSTRRALWLSSTGSRS